MRIYSANSHRTAFKSNIPCRIFQRTVNNTLERIPEHFEKGVVMALVRRLNQKTSAEKTFLTSLIPDFQNTQAATSSYLGAKNFVKDRNVILGRDALWVNELRDECYRKQNITIDETNDIIHRTIIDPLKNKVRFFKDKTDRLGELASLILFVDKKGKGFQLNGMDMRSLDGRRIFARLKPVEKISKNIKHTANINQQQAKITPNTEKITSKLIQDDFFGYKEPQLQSAVLYDAIPNKRWIRNFQL